MKRFIVVFRHDYGKFCLLVHCDNEERAIELVMKAEGLPRRAIVKVVSKETARTL
jgi:hypothetical protein